MNKKIVTYLISTVAVVTCSVIASSAFETYGKNNIISAAECSHSNVEHHDAVSATYNSNGSIEYWCCCDCHTSFKDEACTKIIENTTGSEPKASSDGRHADRLIYRVKKPIEIVETTGTVELPSGFESCQTFNGTGKIDSKYTYLDLSQFKEISWAVKAESSGWYEAFQEYSDAESFTACGGNTDWTTYKFVDEGNGYFQGYKNNAWVGQKLPLNYNLGQMYLKFTSGQTFYHTEIKCVARDTEFASKVTKIKDYAYCEFWDGEEVSGQSFDWAYNNSVSVYGKTCTWGPRALESFDYSLYTDFMFAVRGTASGAYTYISSPSTSMIGGEKKCPTTWTTVWLHKESAGTWTLRWAWAYETGITLTNLNEITFQVAAAGYQFTSLYAIAEA